jgi:hypothetical protein
MASSVSLANNQKAIIWDYNDWMSTLNKQYSASATITPIPMAGDGFSSATRYNPFRFAGYAAPGFDATDVTNVSSVTETCRNLALSAESSTSYGYLITDGAKLQRLVVSSKTISNTGSWPHTITGVGAITGSDVIAYTANVGGTAVPCIFYSWNDSGGTWNVGRFITSTGAFDDDFMSTVPATPLVPAGNNKPHAMWVGANDILYIWDGNLLHAYDGATGVDGTFSSTVLRIPQGYIGTSFATYDNGSPYLICFAYYSPVGNTVTPNIQVGGKATAYFYDYLSLDPTRVVTLDDRIVTCGFSWKGTMGCFTEGNNIVNDGTSRISRLKIFNGAEFETAVMFIGDSPIHGGADLLGDSIQWNSEGILHSFGSPFEGMETTFQKLGKGTGTTSGVLRTIGGGTTGFQVISSGATTSGGLQYMAKDTFAENAILTAPPYLPTFNKGMVGKLRSIRVEYGKTAANGRGLNLYMVYQNGAIATIINDLVTTITASTLTAEYYFDTAGSPLPIFTEIRPLIEWTGGSANTSAAIFKRIVATYEEVNLIGT